MFDAEDHEHDYSVLVKYSVQPTCKANGEAIYKCSKCDKTNTVVVAASAEYHNFVKINDIVNATETTTGIAVYQCSICGEVETRTTPVLECNHNEENPEKADSLFNVTKHQEATCKAAGETRYTCSKCGKEIVKILPMLEHESNVAEGRGSIITDAVKCVSDGSEEVTCKYCGDKFIRPISAHRYEVVKEIPATCTEPTKVVSKCKDCGIEKTEVKVVNRVKSEPLGHNFAETDEVSVTCTTDGRIAKVCLRCGYTEKVEKIAEGHKPNASGKKYYAVKYDEDGKIVKLQDNNGDIEITNYKPGMKSCEYAIAEYFTCGNPEHATTDKEVVTVVAEKQAHSIDTTKPVVRGIFLCDDKGEITINRDSENKVAGLKNAKVDCTHAEAEVFTCKTCGDLEYRIVTEKTSHVEVAGSERRVNPTCTDAGYTFYTCSICKAEVKDTEIAKLGHSFAIKEANCTEDAKLYCSICNKTATVTKDGSNYKVSPDGAYTLEGADKYVNELTDAQKETVIKKKSEGGHDFTGISVTTVDGVKGKYCTKCQKFVPLVKVETAPANTAASDLLGKSLAELKNENINVDISNGVITGTLGKVENFVAFNEADVNEQSGYYLVLYFADAINNSTGTVKVTAPKGTVDITNDGLFILFMGKDEIVKDKSITINSGDKAPITLKLDLTAKTV